MYSTYEYISNIKYNMYIICKKLKTRTLILLYVLVPHTVCVLLHTELLIFKYY